MEQANFIFEDLSKWFGRKPVFTKLSCKLTAGEILGIRGQNGSGKTTLLRCLAGLNSPTSGKISWPNQVAKQLKRPVLGVLDHDNFFYETLKLIEILKIHATIRGLDDLAVTRVLDDFGLQEIKFDLISTLSQGFRRRAALAVAFLGDPLVLILDEPFSNLDAKSAGKLVDLLRQRKSSTSVTLLSYHQQAEVQDLCDYSLDLSNGLESDISRGASR
ncbi:ABC transporter ATP-binding protein [bacterium]|nr:ABC transporter ATP-binding protein [bacterium]